MGGTFGGVPVVAGDVLIRFKLAGDADLNATVDFNDLARLAQNYNTTNKFRWQGDFTYDGNVDFNDLALMAQNYNTTLPTPAGPVPGAPVEFEADWARALASVPEPSFFGAIALGAFALLRGRRPRT